MLNIDFRQILRGKKKEKNTKLRGKKAVAKFSVKRADSRTEGCYTKTTPTLRDTQYFPTRVRASLEDDEASDCQPSLSVRASVFIRNVATLVDRNRSHRRKMRLKSNSPAQPALGGRRGCWASSAGGGGATLRITSG